jgi:transcriptional regulator with PAS, ATPase and Fis domain
MPFTLDETERTHGPLAFVRVPRVTLVVVDGASRGATIQAGGSPVRVGSSEACALRLDDRRVSRVHFELAVSSDRIAVRDLGSTNGTFVDSVRVRDADVGSGSVIRAGDSALRVDVDQSPAQIALSPRASFGELLGASVEMRMVYAVLERAAQADATVLLLGETGTGKDVAARSLHAESSRRAGPFVPVDCGAIPENLIESELFGHVRGAFTGAIANRKGAFEEADGGTLFLDEIGEMPLALQPKLLRALETKSIRRVGETQTRPVSVRIVAATNRPLARAVNEGTFREDLYYRLAVIEVALPPLRARRADVPALAQSFYERMVPGGKLPDPYVAHLETKSWPGNVRELRNTIERDVALGLPRTTEAVPASPPPALPSGIESIVPLHMPLKEARAAWSRAFDSIYVRAMLDKTSGNVTRAAEAAGVSRRFLQRMMARLGMSSDDDD